MAGEPRHLDSRHGIDRRLLDSGLRDTRNARTSCSTCYYPRCSRSAKAQTGVNDAQWIQRLHSCGLLRASFRPDREISALRSYLRLRERRRENSAAHIQRMQKALSHMNLQLHHVVADVAGVTGMRIIRAIVVCERSPSVLAVMSDTRCKAGIYAIEAALVCNYQPEYIFGLAQALAMKDSYHALLPICDQQIAQVLIKLSQEKVRPSEPLLKPRHKPGNPMCLTSMSAPCSINWSAWSSRKYTALISFWYCGWSPNAVQI